MKKNTSTKLLDNNNCAQCLKCYNLVWLLFKSRTKNKNKGKKIKLFSQSQPNEPITRVKYPTLLYAKNQMSGVLPIRAGVQV